MEINELYLKTAFCTMACDGDIADEEIGLVRDFVTQTSLFDGLDVQSKLNDYIAAINRQGKSFLTGYLDYIINAKLDEPQELEIAKIAIKMIEADKKIEYSEISFFKKIRAKLSVSDEKLRAIFKDETLFDKFPEVEPEDFLLPDIIEDDYIDWDVSFDNIKLYIEKN